ncbi:MAG: hypothetical protein KAS32_26330 [Candidatus Peribacteraceae bacterium]|nr:hypothetical protein [Candidatus Peribacteraceae bacterium]
MAILDADNRVLSQYHKKVGHNSLGSPTPQTKVITIDAPQLDPVGAALAAHGTSVKFEHVRVIPLADADEIHYVITTPHDFDGRYRYYLRWQLISNNAAGGAAITTTVDELDAGSTQTGSDEAGEPATALDTPIPAITDAETTADVPFYSDWGIKIPVESGPDINMIHLKLVASSASGADRLRVMKLQFGYWPLTA